MSVKLIIGSQWGDEGKAKIIDYLSRDIDIVIRYQGGTNAGHTVKVGDTSYIFHLVPSGILYPNTICILGAGMVISPESFLEELKTLSKKGVDYKNRIFIADNAHLLLPYHSKIDVLMEDNQKTLTVGTTKKGIGVCYADKINRVGIRIANLLDPDFYKNKLPLLIQQKNEVLKKLYNEAPIDLEKLQEMLQRFTKEIKPFLINLPVYIEDALEKNKNILLEGAQGNMLDLDYGTYPYVTSSNPTVGGALTGSSISHKYLADIIGITKAYTTRVGEGPFPTEVFGEELEKIRKLGNEYGTTTGRPRRCGWFDVPIIKHAKRINGLTYLVLTKLDILDTLEEIKICTHYEFYGQKIDYFPSYSHKEIKPVYESLPGWLEKTSHLTKYSKLPQKAKDFIKFIEHQSGLKVKILSIGPERSNTIEI